MRSHLIAAEPAGLPPVEVERRFRAFDLRWAEPIGLPQCPYMRRWVLVVFGRSIRLHHWMASDDQRYMHDHAWDYWALILKGGYCEVAPGARLLFRAAGDLNFYRAEHRHTVRVDPAQGCWSLLFTGRPRRAWGFWVPGRTKLLRPLRYFSRYGHHPCE